METEGAASDESLFPSWGSRASGLWTPASWGSLLPTALSHLGLPLGLVLPGQSVSGSTSCTLITVSEWDSPPTGAHSAF